jgi:hypothetical protein
MTSLLNVIKIYQLVQKLLGGTHRQTDRRDLISLTLLFKESRLKMAKTNDSISYAYAISSKTQNLSVQPNIHQAVRHKISCRFLSFC